jgi:hypothetical protein
MKKAKTARKKYSIDDQIERRKIGLQELELRKQMATLRETKKKFGK